MVSCVLVIDEAIPSQSRLFGESARVVRARLMHGELAPIFVRQRRPDPDGDLRRLEAA
jgi:hypothetical protein